MDFLKSFRVALIEFGVPTEGGLVYTRETMEKAVERVHLPLFGYRSDQDTSELHEDTFRRAHASHVVKKFIVDDERVVIEVGVLQTTSGHELLGFLDKTGSVDLSLSFRGDTVADKAVMRDIIAINWNFPEVA